MASVVAIPWRNGHNDCTVLARAKGVILLTGQDC